MMKTLIFLSIMLITCGSIVLIVFRFLKKQSSREVVKLRAELRKQRQEFFLPSRLDAYQRSVLLMERIHPNSLIMRTHNPGLNAKLYQAELAKSVRNEFEHNVAQQIFISPVTWGIMKSSKEEVIKLIHMAGNQMDEKATSIQLSEKIMEIVAQVEQFPTEIAVEALKKEFQDLL